MFDFLSHLYNRIVSDRLIIAMLFEVILSCILLLIFFFMVKKAISIFSLMRTINRIPGQKPLWPFGNVLPFLLAPSHEYFRLAQRAYMDSGSFNSLTRFWTFHIPNVSVMRATAAEVILKSSREITKNSAYNFLRPWLGDGLLTSNGRKWQIRRKMITPSFHFRVLDNFMSIFNEQSSILVDVLNETASSSQPVNIFPLMMRCTLDIICCTAMGVRVNAQTNCSSKYVKSLAVLLENVVLLSARPWMSIPLIYKFSSIKARNDKCLKVIHEFTEDVIRERKKEIAANKTVSARSEEPGCVFGRKRTVAFLDTLLEAMANGEGYLTDKELRDEVDTFMFEGHDTTAAALTWVLFYVSWNPAVQEKIYEELESIFGDDMNKAVCTEDLTRLKYLEAVIKESLRLSPSVPVFGRTLTEDVVFDGYTVPAGIDVWIYPYFIHRDPNEYENPEQFNPDRFYFDSGKKRHPYAYVPFSAGPRNCIGQKFALMEEKVVLSHFFRQYKVRSYDRLEDLKVAMIIARPIYGLKLYVEKRELSRVTSSCLSVLK